MPSIAVVDRLRGFDLVGDDPTATDCDAALDALYRVLSGKRPDNDAEIVQDLDG